MTKYLLCLLFVLCAYSAAQCNQDEILCVDLNKLPTSESSLYYLYCENNQWSELQIVPNHYVCHNNKIQIDENLQVCVKEGIQCSNPYGVHLKDQYTDYIMECKDHILSKPVMLDTNLVCYQDRIFKNEVQAHRRLQQTHQYCSFTSYACVNEELEFVNDEATFYVATCEDHTLHGPQRMAGNFVCYHNTTVTACSMFDCCSNTVDCVDSQGNIKDHQCTSYIRYCSNGVEIIEELTGNAVCLNGMIVNSVNCETCDWKGIRCVTAENDPTMTQCTQKYYSCINNSIYGYSTLTGPIYCLNNSLSFGPCPSNKCSFSTINCVDVNGMNLSDECTPYYTVCQDGLLSGTKTMPSGSFCYNNQTVTDDKCQPCYYHNPQCVDENKQNVTDSCTEFIAYCENRYTPIYEPLPASYRCYNNEIVPVEECKNCDFTGLHCTTSNGDPVTDACSCFYTECIEGHTTNPIPVEGTKQCYNNHIVDSSLCSNYLHRCNYSGIRCSNKEGESLQDTCTTYYTECTFGLESEVKTTEVGKMCFNNKLIEEGVCAGTKCDTTANYCVSEENSIVTDECTSRLLHCTEGTYASSVPVPENTMCKNGVIVQETECNSNPCSCNSIRCVTMTGDYVRDMCTSSYSMCTNGIESSIFFLSAPFKCFNNQIVSSPFCPNQKEICSFEGKKCVLSNSQVVHNECTPLYVECTDSTLSSILFTDENHRCYNGSIIDNSQCPVSNVQKQELCSFTGIQCVDNSNNIVKDTYTQKYATCQQGVLTYGTSEMICYNGSLMSQSRRLSATDNQEDLLSWEKIVMNKAKAPYLSPYKLEDVHPFFESDGILPSYELSQLPTFESILCLENEISWLTANTFKAAVQESSNHKKSIVVSWSISASALKTKEHIYNIEVISLPALYHISIPIAEFERSVTFSRLHTTGPYAFQLRLTTICNSSMNYLYSSYTPTIE